MDKNGSPAVGGRTAAAAAATVADATIGLAGLVVAMVMTGATPGKLEISSGGGVEAVVDLGGARWITVEPGCWLDSWVCSDNYRFLKDCSNLMRRMNCMGRWRIH